MAEPLSEPLVIFTIENQPFAIRVSAVERVLRAAEIAMLPDAPATVRGVINVAGRILPVFDPRVRFHLPARELRASDHLIVARAGGRSVALLVDSVEEVVGAAEAPVVSSAAIIPGLQTIAGVVKLRGEIVFIHDLETFLSADHAQVLETALHR